MCLFEHTSTTKIGTCGKYDIHYAKCGYYLKTLKNRDTLIIFILFFFFPKKAVSGMHGLGLLAKILLPYNVTLSHAICGETKPVTGYNHYTFQDF